MLVNWLVGMPVAKRLQTAQLQQQIRTDSELQQPGCLWIRLQNRAEVCQFGWCFLQQEALLSLSKSLDSYHKGKSLVELKVSFLNSTQLDSTQLSQLNSLSSTQLNSLSTQLNFEFK